nr:site-specific integrase [uncultured Campylobacter sp.]
MTFQKYSKLWLDLGQKSWKPSTYDKNCGIVKTRLKDFASLEINDIKPSFIRLWLASIDDVSNKSKKHYISALSGIFTLALQDEVINRNPITFLKSLQHTSPRIEPFSNDEVTEILAESKKYSQNFQIFVRLGFFTGMRTGEIIALKLKDIDLVSDIISINSTRSRFGEGTPKTAKSMRKVPILKNLRQTLCEFIDSRKFFSGYLLENQYHKPYRDSQIFQDIWSKILADLGIKYRRPYTMRHTYATFMLTNNYVTPVKLAALLGHSTPKMIYNVYVNFVNQNLQDFNRDLKLY